MRGVRVLPLPWLVGRSILDAEKRLDLQDVKTAVNALGAEISCYPSAAPRSK